MDMPKNSSEVKKLLENVNGSREEVLGLLQDLRAKLKKPETGKAKQWVFNGRQEWMRDSDSP